MLDWAFQSAARHRAWRNAPLILALFCVGGTKIGAQDAQHLSDSELCQIFEEKAAAVNVAYAHSPLEGFRSIEANVDCAQGTYVQNGILTDLAAASIAQVGDEIRSSYVSATCQDRTIWDVAFGRGWTTTFKFVSSRADTLLSMTLNSCDATSR